MKIPSKIDIVGQVYDVILSDNLKEDLKDILKQRPQDAHYVGYFSSVWQKIWIDNTMKQSQKEQTLMHEVLEVINHELALGISHDNLDRLEHCLYYVLSKNKLLKE